MKIILNLTGTPSPPVAQLSGAPRKMWFSFDPVLPNKFPIFKAVIVRFSKFRGLMSKHSQGGLLMTITYPQKSL